MALDVQSTQIDCLHSVTNIIIIIETQQKHKKTEKNLTGPSKQNKQSPVWYTFYNLWPGNRADPILTTLEPTWALSDAAVTLVTNCSSDNRTLNKLLFTHVTITCNMQQSVHQQLTAVKKISKESSAADC